MTQQFLSWLQSLIAGGDVHPFYVSVEWRSLSAHVLQDLDNRECQICKKRGRFSRAVMVHHVNHVRRRPDLALDLFYWADGEKKRNLISVCKRCHENVCHPERLRRPKVPTFETEERWD